MDPIPNPLSNDVQKWVFQLPDVKPINNPERLTFDLGAKKTKESKKEAKKPSDPRFPQKQRDDGTV